jgi:hypothetical protein
MSCTAHTASFVQVAMVIKIKFVSQHARTFQQEEISENWRLVFAVVQIMSMSAVIWTINNKLINS